MTLARAPERLPGSITIRANSGRPANCIGNLPLTADLCLYQGDDAYFAVVVTDQDGDPADLTGVVAMSQIRLTFAEQWPIAEFTPTVVGNVVYLHLTSEQATQLIPGRAVWDVQITYPSGRVSTLAAGAVTTFAEVTR